MLPTLLGGLLLPAVASAQRAEPADAAPAVEVTVHGSARAAGEDLDGTRVVQVTTEDDLRDAGNVQSLADALRRRPGTSVQQTSPGQGTIYVRGLSGRAVLHVVDGVRLNSTFFRAGNNPYLGLVDVHALQSIGVVGGASSLLYGSDGLAGAVYMETRLPGYHYGGDLRALRVDQTLTSNPWAYTTRVGAEAASERWAVAGGYTVSAASAIRPGEGTRTPVPSSYVGLERAPGAPYRPAMSLREQGTESTFQAGDVSVRRRLVREVELVLRGQAGELPHLVRYDEITPRFKLEYPSRAESSVEALYRLMASATLAHQPRHVVYDELQAQLSYQRLHEAPLRRSFDELCLGEEDESGCAGLRQLRPAAERLLEENASDAVGARVVARFGGDPGRMGLVGVDVHHDVITSRASSLDVGTGVRTESASRYPTGSSQTQTGVFASVTQTPIEGFTVHGGCEDRSSAWTSSHEPPPKPRRPRQECPI